MKKNTAPKRRCAECDSLYTPTINRKGKKAQRYCSRKCGRRVQSREWRKAHPNEHWKYRPLGSQVRIFRECVICEEVFHPHSTQKCCSPKCLADYKTAWRRANHLKNPGVRIRAEKRRGLVHSAARKGYHDEWYKDHINRARAACALGLAEMPHFKVRGRLGIIVSISKRAQELGL